jgi:hypothetical protein
MFVSIQVLHGKTTIQVLHGKHLVIDKSSLLTLKYFKWGVLPSAAQPPYPAVTYCLIPA